MNDFDLRTGVWIPWRLRDGTVEWGALSMLVRDTTGRNPVVALASPRADFDGAFLEVLIGVYAAALKPADDDEWCKLWENPPSEVEVQAALSSLPDAFRLDAEHGPRFLQDLSAADLEGQDVLPVERLLIDSPGEQTLKLSKAHFVPAGRFEALGLPAAAMALITMQCYAPSGGAGNRTSMRGGGPLTTLVDPRMDDGSTPAHLQPLWKKIWMNVPTRENVEAMAPPMGLRSLNRPELIYPWLAETRVSVKGKPPVTPTEAHPMQAFFGMPRRIRLEFGGPGICALTGDWHEKTVVGFRMRNYGVNYEGWLHPLSPHYQAQTGAGWLPIHGQPSGIGWRDWPGLTLVSETASRRPATAIVWAQNRARGMRRQRLYIHAFGYDLDNMKARGWIDAVQPLYGLAPDEQRLLGQTTERLVEAADLVASEVSRQIRYVEFGNAKETRGDYSWVRETVFRDTEADFFGLLDEAVRAGLDMERLQALRAGFLLPLRDAAYETFDARCPSVGANIIVLQRIVSARYGLASFLRGYTRLGTRLYELLDLPAPGGGASRAPKRTPRKRASS